MGENDLIDAEQAALWRALMWWEAEMRKAGLTWENIDAGTARTDAAWAGLHATCGLEEGNVLATAHLYLHTALDSPFALCATPMGRQVMAAFAQGVRAGSALAQGCEADPEDLPDV